MKRLLSLFVFIAAGYATEASAQVLYSLSAQRCSFPFQNTGGSMNSDGQRLGSTTSIAPMICPIDAHPELSGPALTSSYTDGFQYVTVTGPGGRWSTRAFAFLRVSLPHYASGTGTTGTSRIDAYTVYD